MGSPLARDVENFQGMICLCMAYFCFVLLCFLFVSEIDFAYAYFK